MRLNPLYRHDYALWQQRQVRWAGMPSRYRPNGSIASANARAAETALPSEILALDSRYFVVNGEPLALVLTEWHYQPTTLGDYLCQSDNLDIRTVRIRDFDASRDYGIGAWLDPDTRYLPPLPRAPATGRGSWFYHVNEPIWEVHPTSALQAPLTMAELPDGQHIEVGRDRFQRATYLDSSIADERQAQDNTRRVVPQPILVGPSRCSEELTSTQLRFLVCLDGYIRPQVVLAFRLASEAKALLKKRCDTAQSPVSSTATNTTKAAGQPHVGAAPARLLACLHGAATRTRQHWRAVTVDLAAALGGQQLEVEALLTKEQNAQRSAGGYSTRMRGRNESNLEDNALKRALCVIELRLHSSKAKPGLPLSWGRINAALYRRDTADYYAARGLPVPVAVKLTVGGVPDKGNRERVRSALALGHSLARGWYEFVAARRFEF